MCYQCHYSELYMGVTFPKGRYSKKKKKKKKKKKNNEGHSENKTGVVIPKVIWRSLFRRVNIPNLTKGF